MEMAIIRTRCTRTYRRIETVFLGVLFISLSVLLYNVLTSDHITVMSWFGVKVDPRLKGPRQKLTSKQEQSHKLSTSLDSHNHRIQNIDNTQNHLVDHQDGLYIDTVYKTADNSDSLTIAIGCAITSRSLKSLNLDTVGQVSPFLRTFLPSFCKTIQDGPQREEDQHIQDGQQSQNSQDTNKDTKYTYKMFLAYDSADAFFSNITSKRAFRNTFEKIVLKLCPLDSDIKLYFVRCPYTKRPAWSQNDAMFTAYLANSDYFYRVNDDTMLTSNNWVDILTTTLTKLNPSNIGVAGPMHYGGNTIILAHDFVHKTHMDIFGFYYPRTFPDWWADDWISGVYGMERTKKLDSVRAIHTGEKGTRYNHTWSSPAVLTNRLNEDRNTLNGYLTPSDLQVTLPHGKKVISMSLYGDDPKYTYGAVRNAVLAPRIFRGWTLRIYLEKVKEDGSTVYPATPKLIINKLKEVGAELVYVDAEKIKVPPMMWRYLVADDRDVEYFIVRDTDSRLIARDAEVVAEWITETEQPFHCVRDHPSHRSAPLFGGLIGGRSSALREVIREEWRGLMQTYAEDYGMDIIYLSNTIWPRVKDHTVCHDSITCRQWGPSRAWPFPTPRRTTEHVGQVFDAFGEARSIDTDLLMLYPEAYECTLREGESRQSWLTKQKANARAEAKAAEATHSRGWRKSGLSLAQSELEEDRLRREEAKIPSLVGKVVIWTMDYDTDYIRDLKSLLGPRGVRFVDKSLAPNCKSVGTCPHNLTVVIPGNGMEAEPGLRDKFYNSYKDDPEMLQVTHFLCVRPVAMCELYMKFKKSMLVIATGRYEEGRLTPARWQQLNDNITGIEGDSKNIVGASNHYDVEYMRYFTGFDPEYLPPYCAYTEDIISNTTVTKTEFLVATLANKEFKDFFMDELQKTLAKVKAKVKVVYVDDLYPQGHTLSDLIGHPGIIHVPEKVSNMRVCEQYRLAIPLYFPSMELLIKYHKQFKLLTNRTFSMDRLHKHGISISGSPIRAAAMGRFDPNDDFSSMSLRYWLRFADFVQLPHVGHYENLEDLIDQLQINDPRVTSNQMSRFNRRFRREMVTKWISLINRTLL